MANADTIVGMSGGVDSSVAAVLLQRSGECIAGLFMQNWEEDGHDGGCRADADRKDAVAVCAMLGIPLYPRNFASEYRDRVFSHFLDEYRRRTNPESRRVVQSRDQVQDVSRTGPRPRRFANRNRTLRAGRRHGWTLAPQARARYRQGPNLFPARAGSGGARGNALSTGRPAQERGASDRTRCRTGCSRQEGFHRHLLHRRTRLPVVSGCLCSGTTRTRSGLRKG